ncbi:MAG: DUF4276 family protein [Chitinispirillaceae bacterium]|nr:DUF4276 family protein [Chitinispirillaceae bacterium]
MRKIGFIFECGREGPDIKVCRHLVHLIDPEIEMVTRSLDNAGNLRQYCGPTAKLLLESCKKVLIIWDLYPPWREGGVCLHDDREEIFSSLRAAGVSVSKVALVCIHEELESWLLADDRALKKFIADKKHPHPVRRIKKYKKPDLVKNPKAVISKIFNQELGNSRKYIDYQDAGDIAQQISDLIKVIKSESFERFYDKLKP